MVRVREEHYNQRLEEQYECKKCGINSTVCIGNETAIRNWNIRAPILSAEEMEVLNERSL